MKRFRAALTLVSAALVGCQHDTLAPAAGPPGRDRVPVAAAAGGVVSGQYVVLFHPGRVGASGADPAAAATRMASAKVPAKAGVLRHTFGYVVQGFAATLTDSAVAALRQDPDVALIEPDHVVRATGAGVQSGAPWALDRIDQTALPLDGAYRYANDGTGTAVYILDTGINLSHADFGGRAVAGQDFVTAGGTPTDCNGHGTHVAGIVGGAAYGVAKGARLVAVRVLDCSGNGSESGVIAALDWVAQQRRAAPATPAVVNMSLSGDPAPILDSAVARTVAAGVTVAVAAGNAAVDACGVSPARAPSALTVAATDASDAFAGFSNYGACVDLAAPGVNVVSDWVGGTTATATLSGTSMASPHVAGVAALYLAANPSATPAQVAAALVGRAGTGAIQGLPANTPSRLLYSGFLSAVTVRPGPIVSGVPLPNVCLDIAGGTASAPAAGAPLQAWQCHGGANQQFTLNADGTITAYGGQRCLDVAGAQANDGDNVVAWPCHGGINQKWVRTSAGQLQTAINGKCLDLWGAQGQNGAPIKVWSCHGGYNQRWTVTGAPAATVAALAGPVASRAGSVVRHN